MTTITREQQKQILIDTANHVISRDNTSPYSENLRELARIALAALEAEPIGAFHIADQQVGGTSDYIKDGEWPIDNGVIEVYAAPPVLVVPEERPSLNNGIVGFDEGWNACRADMLQGAEPVSQTYKLNELSGNSPVTQDGWISCSERMPAQDDWVLIYSKYGEYLAGQVQGEYVELNDGTLSWLGTALHWMPLPAAPEPEGNNR
ncbi:DUF551 domain-containing protein [Salmonella enterica subsp. enterica serovar Javiana]|nr:DUF551 domain-containing protein [Salmonella enterica subsp. enterica serovar Javiana]